jgi:hypothetical protein
MVKIKRVFGKDPVNKEELNSIINNLKDIVSDLGSDLNDEYLYDVHKFAGIVSSYALIVIRIWKNGPFFKRHNLLEIKPVIDRVINYMKTESVDIKSFTINHWNEDSENVPINIKYIDKDYLYYADTSNNIDISELVIKFECN